MQRKRVFFFLLFFSALSFFSLLCSLALQRSKPAALWKNATMVMRLATGDLRLFDSYAY
jgi:hypothetical protein